MNLKKLLESLSETERTILGYFLNDKLLSRSILMRRLGLARGRAHHYLWKLCLMGVTVKIGFSCSTKYQLTTLGKELVQLL